MSLTSLGRLTVLLVLRLALTRALLLLARLLAKGATVQLKGFVIEGVRKTGKLRFDPNYELHFEEKPGVKPAAAPVTQPAAVPDRLPCPRCGEGQILKGKTAYGCSRWREGCTWRYDFVEVKRVAAGRALTRELVWGILREGK